MARKDDWDDEDFYEDDEDSKSIWQQWDEQDADAVAAAPTADKNVLKAERHRQKLLRQMKERDSQ